MKKYRVVMLRSEEDPAVCHRALLVGRALRECERRSNIFGVKGESRRSMKYSQRMSAAKSKGSCLAV
jgi:hypothetical protein